MWLLDLRFDDAGTVRTHHNRTDSKVDVQELLTLAEQHGLTPTARLVEYAAFPVSGHIKLRGMLVSNFHFSDHSAFVARWNAVSAST